jgi:transposase
MPESKIELMHPSIKIDCIYSSNPVLIHAEYQGKSACPGCGGYHHRIKDRITRWLRHESIGVRNCYLVLTLRKRHCQDCSRYFRESVPGLLPYKRSTEAFRREIFYAHKDGISQEQLKRRRKIGTATVERWFHELLDRKHREFANRLCPRVLGIDEKFFSKKEGYATTFADLGKHRVFDVALGRSEASLHKALHRMRGRDRVQVVCMDLSSTYRSIVRRYFPNALIVADRFHVVRLVIHHLLEVWKQIDPVGRKNRGLLSLMRRGEEKLSMEQKEKLQAYFEEHPGLAQVYEAKTRLHALLRVKTQTKKMCRRWVKELFYWIEQLRQTPFESSLTLARTLESWSAEIGRMWRFTKSNGITEGLHTKMELIKRRAYGFKNFENYRLRVKVLCG